jgi:hypothetical protein
MAAPSACSSTSSIAIRRLMFSLIYDVPESQRHFLRGKTPKTSFMQRLPFAKKHYRKMLPLMPYAIEQLDVSAYDLILSSSYAVAKGVLTGPNQLHVCYCYFSSRTLGITTTSRGHWPQQGHRVHPGAGSAQGATGTPATASVSTASSPTPACPRTHLEMLLPRG